MKSGTVLMAAAAALFASMPILAQASSISTDPVFYNRVNASNPYNSAGDFHVSSSATPGLNASDNGASASTSNDYSRPSISSSVSTGYNASGSAESDLTYYFTLNGPGASSAVHITASGYVTNSGGGGGSGFLTIGPAGNASTFVDEGMNSGPYGNPPLISLSQTFDLTVGAIYRVTMTTHVNANDVGTATAYLDPYIKALDPLYSITTFGGIGNSVAPTPIPATLPLFGAGLGALGLAARRKRKMAARAA